ncbi:MAG: TolC family protein [Bdellovibrionales bacterium]|nr:TolC family protein [Bdellovibrionales bacterium]
MKNISLLFFIFAYSASAKTWSLDQIILKTLENSRSIQIIQAQKSADKLIQAEALLPFDWQVGWNYILPKTPTANNFNVKNFNSNFSLQKKWLYGLNFKTTYCHTTAETPCSHLPPSALAPPYSRTVSLSLEQNIFRNIFGREDRLKLQSAEYKYQSAKFTRTEDIKKLILTTAEKFWNSYAFYIYVQQAKQRSRDYKELADLAQQKSKMGHILPGEIPQILSQYERTIKQQKEMETQLKNSMIDLQDFTQIKDKKFNFAKHRTLPIPRLSLVNNVEQLNAIQAVRAHHSSTIALLDAQKYFYLPYVKLHAGADFLGHEKTWFQTVKSAELKNYRIGIAFVYPLSHSPSRWKQFRYLRSKKLQHELEYEDHKQTISNQLKISWNQLENAHSSLKASFKILKLQKQALDEIRKSYIQGRVPINTLISAQDRNTEVEKENLQAQRNYNLSLLRYYSLRDKLLARYKK